MFLHAPLKRVEEVDVELRLFLTSALDGDEWSSSRYGRFTLRERVPVVFWDGTQSGSGRLGEEKNLLVLEVSVVVCKGLNWDLAFVASDGGQC